MRLAYLIDLFSFLMHEFDKLSVGIRNFFEKIVHLQLIDKSVNSSLGVVIEAPTSSAKRRYHGHLQLID